MSTFNWSRFTVGININASKKELYHAWASQHGIEKWFLRLSEYRHADGRLLTPEEEVRQGDNYLWFWHGWPDETREKGEILDANGSDYFKFSFGNAGICSVRIQPYKDEHIVQLVQEEIPDTEEGRQNWHLGCKAGWTFYLANMKSVMEGGIDLRNKDISVKSLLNK